MKKPSVMENDKDTQDPNQKALQTSSVEGLEGLKSPYPELAEELITAIQRMWKVGDFPLKDGLISEKRAAIYLGVSPRTLVNWRAAKLIPHYKIRGRILYRRSEIDDALKNKYRKGSIGVLH